MRASIYNAMPEAGEYELSALLRAHELKMVVE